MLEFSKLQISDIGRLRPFIRSGNTRVCNNTVGSIFMWRDYFSTEYAIWGDSVIFKVKARHDDIDTMFSIPLGGDYISGTDKVNEYCHGHNIPVVYYALTENDLEPLRSIYSSHELFSDDDWGDYVYNASDLITLAGRKYSGKRNHINQFKKDNPDYSFEEITSANFAEVRDFYDELSRDLVFTSKTASEDHDKTLEVLSNYEAYAPLGGLLRTRGSVVAFSAGDIIGDMLFVHIEKADTLFRGAYQVINNEFAKHFASDGILFINREEDEGDLGLRFSKNSYHPVEITRKYIFIVL
ncbi:MAG: phosphatidylglycerol lysyltransferase domain-containing protein [Oscillospiraceae bacterium]|nr:phosphatidylglycerol lysyltransferase domain-containing protein [Oscillospiraceae bacterium]MCL2277785.1 phosphatidylglycerol lysyltransferase domain-containing protein [Oscillospiraceae bacterium]